MEQTPHPRFDLWLPALESGLLALPDLIAWADREIMRLSKPPKWLIDLSLSSTTKDVYLARSNLPDSLDIYPHCSLDVALLAIGMLYIRYQAEDLPLHDLLLKAGQFADNSSSSALPACEEFFYLLNEVEGRDPQFPDGRPIAERVRELFAPMARHATDALPHLTTLSRPAV